MSDADITRSGAPETRPDLEIKPLRLADAAVLRRMGVFSGSLKSVQESIRRLLAQNGHGCRLVTRTPAPPAAAMTGFVALVPDTFTAAIGRLSIHATHADFLPELLELACRDAFGTQPFLRLEALVPSFPEGPLHAFKEAGFRTDTIIPGTLLRAPASADLHLLSLPKTQNRYPGVGVVPYRLGVLAVIGGEQSVDTIEFLQTGEPVAHAYLRDVFAIWGLLDEKDRLRPSDTCVRLIRNDSLPAMVARAVAQLGEYLAGERTEFDLTLNLAGGSPFQQSVWAALQTIPYGTTETYLDVALKLAAGDLKKARAMSRAVGSACGANPIPVVVPCHRVIGRDGRLVGFSGGIENKEYLLEHELFRRR